MEEVIPGNLSLENYEHCLREQLRILRRIGEELRREEKEKNVSTTANEHFTVPYLIRSLNAQIQQLATNDCTNVEANKHQTEISSKEDLEEQLSLQLQQENKAHESFLKSQSQFLFGGDEVITEVEEYFKSESSGCPLLIIGDDGAGKTSTIAKLVHKAQEFAENQVFYHFVGITPLSKDPAVLLQRLIKHFEPDVNLNISNQIGLVPVTRILLSRKSSTPTIIFIDAIDQIDEEKKDILSEWLPEKISPNIKVILSMTKGTSASESSSLYQHPTKQIICRSLNERAKEEVVRNIFNRSNNIIDRDQIHAILSKNESNNPLWLTLACEEMLVRESTENMTKEIYHLPDNLINLQIQMIEKLESECGDRLIRSALCLLEVSRHGLQESELLALIDEQMMREFPDESNPDKEPLGGQKFNQAAINSALSTDKSNESARNTMADLEERHNTTKKLEENSMKNETENSISDEKRALCERTSAKVICCLKPFLLCQMNSEDSILTFSHPTFGEAVRRKYFIWSEEFISQGYIYWRNILAEYFQSVEDRDRKIEEYPYQLEHSSDYDRLEKFLSDWSMFNQLYDKSSIDLHRYWNKCGGYSLAYEIYKGSLNVAKQSVDSAFEFFEQALKIAMFLLQGNMYMEAHDIFKNFVLPNTACTADQGSTYAYMAYCKSEYLDSMMAEMDHTNPASHTKERQSIVRLYEKSITYSKKRDEEAQFQIAKNKINMCYNLLNIGLKQKAFSLINEAIAVFEKFNDVGSLARCLLLRSFSMSDFNKQQAEIMKARKLCMKAYGKNHKLYHSILFSLGNLYESIGEYERAYDYFMECLWIQEELYGSCHPQTLFTTQKLKHRNYSQIEAKGAMEDRGSIMDEKSNHFEEEMTVNLSVICCDGNSNGGIINKSIDADTDFT